MSTEITIENVFSLAADGDYYLDSDLVVPVETYNGLGNMCGEELTSFSGIIDGRGHSITFHLRSGDATNEVGLVRRLGNGVIKDIDFLNCTLDSAHTAACVFGLACGSLKPSDIGDGQAESRFENITINGCHYENGENGIEAAGNNLGLLIGQFYITSVATPAPVVINNIEINDSSVYSSAITSSQTYHGGLFAKVDPRNAVAITISNIRLNNVDINGYSYVAGIIPNLTNDAQTANATMACSNIKINGCDVASTNGNVGFFGGDLASATLAKRGNFVISDVEITGGSATLLGAGVKCAGFSGNIGAVTVQRCYVDGALVTGYRYLDSGGDSYLTARVAGFAGRSSLAYVKDCGFNGTIAVPKGSLFANGFVGRIDNNDTSYINCYAVARVQSTMVIQTLYDLICTADVSAFEVGSAIIYADDGGLATIGTVVVDANKPNVNTLAITAGANIETALEDVVIYTDDGEGGYIEVGTLASDAAKSVRPCALSRGWGQANTGITPTVTSCYYDSDVTTIEAGGQAELGTAKTTAEMKLAATFDGWDIGLFNNSIWRLINDYPKLVTFDSRNINDLYGNGLNDLYGSGINAAYANGRNDLVSSGLNNAYGTF